MNRFRKLTAIAFAIVMCVSILPISARADQPFMQAALGDLEKAYNALKRATADKGGYRQRALDYTGNAIKLVRDGIDYDRRNPNNRRRNDIDLTTIDMIRVFDQPNMQEAKTHLQAAINNLQKASPDKGGYRTKALGEARQALNETQRGIEYDRKN